ncbi:unnamed protein product [Zymoseptoria tritici ST99CH_1E4]|uniref:alpha-1,2-Mannosidase n=1 Tax=Zymoseptoria tritici ST99CH_1E4 TaxID=1276532 RepID=A0A2H1H3N7_ZYMTR|nr:unnamed protein product [Zymoseptoria tritici ST99CH_1E4]
MAPPRTRRARWLAIAVCIAIVFLLYERSALENVSYPDYLNVGGGSVLRGGDITGKFHDPDAPLSQSPHREPSIADTSIEPEEKTEVKLPEEPKLETPTVPERPAVTEEKHLPALPTLQTEKPAVPQSSGSDNAGPHDDLNNRIDPLYKPPRPATTSSAPPIHWSKQPEKYPITSTRKLPTGTPKPIPRIQPSKPSPADPSRLAAVKKAAQHAWKGYRTHGWGFDEVRPVSGQGKNSFNGWGATLVDSLDTLWIMGMKDEFEEAVNQTANIDFTTSSRDDIPLFEVTIRYLGGLIAAYDVSGRKYQVLMDKALELGEILYSAFDTNNRMPETYYKWKPPSAQKKTYPSGEGRHRVVLAELGTLSLEFTRLAQLSGEDKFYDAIARITDAFEEMQMRTRLPGMWPISVDASGCGKEMGVAASRKETGVVGNRKGRNPPGKAAEDAAAKASGALDAAKEKIDQPPVDPPIKQSTDDTIGPEVELTKEPDAKALAEAEKKLLNSQNHDAHMDAAMEKMDKNVANPMPHTGKQTDLRNPSELTPNDNELTKRHAKRAAIEPDAAALKAAEKILKDSMDPQANMDKAMQAMDKNVANPMAHTGEQQDLRAQSAYQDEERTGNKNVKREAEEAYIPDAAALAAAEKILKDSMDSEAHMDEAMEKMDKNVANPMAHTGKQSDLRAQPAYMDQERSSNKNVKREDGGFVPTEPDAAALAKAEKILKDSQDPEAHMDAAMEKMDKNVANPMAHTGKQSDLRNPSEHAPQGSKPQGGTYTPDSIGLHPGDAPYKAGMGAAYLEQQTASHSDDNRALKNAYHPADELPMFVEDLPPEEETCIPQGLETPSLHGTEVYTLGGQSDSVYEYFPKEYLLLGGQVEQYKTMYLASTKPIIDKLLFRPMTPDNLDILIAGELTVSINYTTELPYDELTPKNEHLTCFAGGMLAMGGRIFNEPSHIELGRKVTEGCVWGYNATQTGIMPEGLHVMACEDVKDCKWNETKWHDELDPYRSYREEQRKQFFEKYPDYVEATTDGVAMERDAFKPKEGLKAKTVEVKPKPVEEDPFNAKAKRQLDDEELGLEETPAGPEEAPAVLGPVEDTIPDALPPSSTEPLPPLSSLSLKPTETTDKETYSYPVYTPTPPKTHEQFIQSKLTSERLPRGFTSLERKYILRPEAIESVWYMFRITGDQHWRDVGWQMFQSVEKATKAKWGHSSISDVTRTGKREADEDGEEVWIEGFGQTDQMESFWLAETLKYFYLLFEESERWGLDEWVLNTEAHFFRRPDAGRWDGEKVVK